MMLQVRDHHSFDQAVARERAVGDVTPAFRQEWQALATVAAEPNAFAEDWFLVPALIHFGGDAIKLIEVRAASGVLAGELIGVIPLCLHHRYGRIPVRHVRNWVHYQCFMGAPLVRSGAEVAFWRALLGWLDGSSWARGLFTMSEMLEDGPLHHALSAVRSNDSVYRYERAALASTLDGEAYLEATVRGKKRKELRRLANRLSDMGPVGFEVLDSSPSKRRDGRANAARRSAMQRIQRHSCAISSTVRLPQAASIFSG
jgi:hypothetical protein